MARLLRFPLAENPASGEYERRVAVGTADGTPTMALPLPDGECAQGYRIGAVRVHREGDAMAADREQLYAQRLNRYTTAMRGGMPDRVPIRPFVAEFCAKYAGMTCQQVTHDYNQAYEAVLRTAADFDWDAMVCNMVWVWTGLTQAIGLKYYAIPGLHIAPDVGFQYREPPEDGAFMRADEYDRLIDDPTAFLLDVWLPRVAAPMAPAGAPVTAAHNLSLLKGGMAMMQYFNSIGGQVQRMRQETGTVSAIAGILKAPMDILADKLRGYLGLLDDLETQPHKVRAACEALAPHLFAVALGSSDPTGTVPIGFWMHRSCVPMVKPEHFSNIFWPTLRPIIEELWRHGRQTLFYAEGNWDYHLDAFAQLPAHSIVYHLDQGNPAKVFAKLGGRFCLSGGIPNALLAYGTPEQVRAKCREVLAIAARDGAYIMDASAIVQNDARVENMQALTEATLEHGGYPRGHSVPPAARPPATGTPAAIGRPTRTPPGACVPWERAAPDWPAVTGDPRLVADVWNQTDGLAYMYAWQVLESF